MVMSKDVVRVARWKVRRGLHVPHTGWTETEKHEFIDALDMMVRLSSWRPCCVLQETVILKENIARRRLKCMGLLARQLLWMRESGIEKARGSRIKDCKAIAGEHATTQHLTQLCSLFVWKKPKIV